MNASNVRLTIFAVAGVACAGLLWWLSVSNPDARLPRRQRPAPAVAGASAEPDDDAAPDTASAPVASEPAGGSPSRPPSAADLQTLIELGGRRATPEEVRTAVRRIYGPLRPALDEALDALRDPATDPIVEPARLLLADARNAAAHAVLGLGMDRPGSDVAFWRLRGDVATWVGDREKEFEAWVTIDSAHTNSRRLGALLNARGRPDLAAPHLVVAARESDDPGELRHAADVALAGGLVDLAVEAYEAAAVVSASPDQHRLRAARALERDQRPDEAIAYIESALRRARSSALAELLERLRSGVRRDEPPARPVAPVRPPAGAASNAAAAGDRSDGSGDDRQAAETDAAPGSSVPRGDAPGADAGILLSLGPGADPNEALVALGAARRFDLASDELPTILGTLGEHVSDPVVRPVFGALLDRALSPRWLGDERFVASALWWADNEPSPDAALDVLSRWSARVPKSVTLLSAIAERAAWAGRAGLELSTRDELLRLASGDRENARRLADLLAGGGDHERAVEVQRTLARRFGGDERDRLDELLVARGDPDALARLLARSERLPIPQRERAAERLLELRATDEALRLHESILDDVPDHPASLRRVAQLRSWANDGESALPLLDRLVVLEPDGEAWFLRGAALLAASREDEARADFARALPLLRAEAAGDSQRERLLAMTLARLDRRDEADAIFERLRAESPGDVHLHLDHAGTLVSAQDFERADEVLADARALGTQIQRFKRLNANVAHGLERYDVAIVELEEALAAYGDDVGILTDLAVSLRADGRPRSAVHVLDRALEIDADSASVRTQRRTIADQAPQAAFETVHTTRRLERDFRRGTPRGVGVRTGMRRVARRGRRGDHAVRRPSARGLARSAIGPRDDRPPRRRGVDAVR